MAGAIAIACAIFYYDGTPLKIGRMHRRDAACVRWFNVKCWRIGRGTTRVHTEGSAALPSRSHAHLAMSSIMSVLMSTIDDGGVMTCRSELLMCTMTDSWRSSV